MYSQLTHANICRFCAEQTITVNTTATGGNAALLAAPH